MRKINLQKSSSIHAVLATIGTVVMAGCVVNEDPDNNVASINASANSKTVSSETINRIEITPTPIDEAKSATSPIAEKTQSRTPLIKASQRTPEAINPESIGKEPSTEPLYQLEGNYSQGGILFGKTRPGSKVSLDGRNIMVGAAGEFVLGFGRDSNLTATLKITPPSAPTEIITLNLEDRQFPEQRIDGLDQSKVSGFTEAQLAKIGEDRKHKNAARASTRQQADWQSGFDWPLTGRISGVFGSRRILNGEPKRPHSGVDIARPTGTPILAPADGVITLAMHDMYFEGGLVLLDHGHWLESAFLHMSRIDVEPGQRVQKGDVIGAVGATGRVTGPHLHWSVRWMSRLVDPQLLAGDMPG